MGLRRAVFNAPTIARGRPGESGCCSSAGPHHFAAKSSAADRNAASEFPLIGRSGVLCISGYNDGIIGREYGLVFLGELLIAMNLKRFHEHQIQVRLNK
jgi:hypothetical protein